MSDNAKSRLLNLEHMSHDDWRGVLKTLMDEAQSEQDRAQAFRIASMIRINIDTEHRLYLMDKTSTSLAKKLVWLTWLLAVFTALLVADAALKVFEGPHEDRHGTTQSQQSRTAK